MAFLPMQGAQNVPLDDAAEQLAVQRRMKIADALRQQSTQELNPQMVGNQLVPASPLQHIARALAGWQANRADTDTMNMASQYADAKRTKLAQALSGLKNADNPDSMMQTGAQLMSIPGGEQLGQQLFLKAADQARSAHIMNQLFPAGQEPAQASAAAPMSPAAQPLGSVDLSPQGMPQGASQAAPGAMSRQQLAAAYASGDPQAIRAATLLWGEQQRDQDRKEARANHVEDLTTQHQWREEDRNAQEAFQRELVKLREGAANKPYFTYQPVTDASGRITGIAKLDARGNNPPELVNIPGMGQAVSTKDSGAVRGAVSEAQGHGQALGKGEAANQLAEPAAATDRQRLADNIDAMLKHPGLDSIYGTFAGSQFSPDLRQQSVDARAMSQQIVNQLSLENRNKMKGQGQISDYEGKLLANAATKLSNPRISAEDARNELAKIKGFLVNPPPRVGVSPGTPGAPSAGPKPGTVEDGHRFKGGNPADPNSWEPVQ